MRCMNCGKENLPNARFCQNCGAPLPRDAQRFCSNCGRYYDSNTRFCPGCGRPTQSGSYYEDPGSAQPKDWLTTLLLCVFLGALGIHRFYVGKIGTGIIWLLTGGLFGIGYIIDIILIATDAFTDQYNMPLRKS